MQKLIIIKTNIATDEIIKDVVLKLTGIGYGCNMGGTFVNLLCYADDMVLIIPSWSALHAYYARQKLQLLTCLVIARKRFVWYLSPINRRNIICNSFPTFKLAGSNLNYVAKFKYLSHLIDNKLCVI